MEAIKILIVDDHAVVRDGLSTMLRRREDLVVVGEARNGREAVEKVSDLRPDVTLMDLRMPEVNGAEAMRRIREENPETKFVKGGEISYHVGGVKLYHSSRLDPRCCCS